MGIPEFNAIVLAGGFGTRLRSVITDVPKPMAPVGTLPFLCYLIRWLKQQGVSKVILSVGHKADIVRNFFGPVWEGVPLLYAFESHPLGTGGALINAMRMTELNKELVVLNGDTYFPINLQEMMSFHVVKNADLTIAGFEARKTDRYSSYKLSKNRRLELTREASSRFSSGGIYVFRDTLRKQLASRNVDNLSFESEITPGLFSENQRIFGYLSDAFFIDIGLPEDYAKAQSACVDW